MEQNSIDSDLIRGHIDTIILKILKTGDRYGYEIIKDVETKSNGTYELKQPTLYSCLKRLESQGLISSYWSDSDIGGKRHYYKLTERGENDLKKNQEEWLKSRSIIDNLIYEENQTPPSISTTQKNDDELLPIDTSNKGDTQINNSISEISYQNDEQDNWTDEVINTEISNHENELENIYKQIAEHEIEDENTFNQQIKEINPDGFVPEFSSENDQDTILKNAQLAHENELQIAEDSPYVRENIEQQEETPLELLAEKNESTLLQNSIDNDDQYEFSTFADEARRQTQIAKKIQEEQESEIQKTNKTEALNLLYEGTDFVENIKQFPDSNNNSTSNAIVEEQEEQQEKLNQNQLTNELSEEQKRATIKMFEGRKIVNASFIDSDYKQALNDLSKYAANTSTSTTQNQIKNSVEYKPQTYATIKKQFEKQGISVRTHQKIIKDRQEKNHIFTNKIKLARSWITFGITSLILVLSIIILKTTNIVDMSIKNALPLYLPAFVILLAYPAIYTIIYWCDPQKRVVAKYAPRISILSSILFFIQALVIIYAINLQTGFTSFNQSGYNHLGWLVPWLSSLAILISSITYYILFKSKRFHS